MDASLAWPALLLLGAVHGINPAMGWLFAVALGLQQQDRGAVWRALVPLAVGHAIAVAAAVAVAVLVGLVLPLRHLQWLVAAALLGAGVLQLVRHRHPRFGGMRIGSRDLAIWSFLMASAHGAGLMAVPFFLRAAPHHAAEHAGHAVHAAAVAGASPGQLAGLLATLLHTLGYLAVTGAVAAVVYERLALRLLRTAWVNLDVLWAAALVGTAVLTLLV